MIEERGIGKIVYEGKAYVADRRYIVEYDMKSGSGWQRESGKGYRTYTFAEGKAQIFQSLGYDARVLDTMAGMPKRKSKIQRIWDWMQGAR